MLLLKYCHAYSGADLLAYVVYGVKIVRRTPESVVNLPRYVKE